MDFDPTPIYESVQIPMLVVYSAQDRFIPVDESIVAYNKAVPKNRNKDITLKVFKTGSHGMSVRGTDGNRTLTEGFSEYLLEWLSNHLTIQPIQHN